MTGHQTIWDDKCVGFSDLLSADNNTLTFVSPKSTLQQQLALGTKTAATLANPLAPLAGRIHSTLRRNL